MLTSFYSHEELSAIGFKSVGSEVFISRHAQFYSPEEMQIGSNVRIDDFCLLSGNIILGNHIHISAYTALYGRFGIEIEDFSGLSPRCTVFSATDDFSGDFLIGPMVNQEFTNVTGGKVLIKKYCQVGSNCVILPNLTINEGVAVGAMSLIIKTLDAWSVYTGIPAKFIKHRNKELLRFL